MASPQMPVCLHCNCYPCRCEAMLDDDWPDDGTDGDGWDGEPIGSCDWCECNLYADDEYDGLCSQCAWLASQR